MIGAIQAQAPLMQPTQTPRLQAPAPMSSSASAPSVESSQSGAMDVLQSQAESENSVQSAQISLYRTSLDITKEMAGELINMVNAPRAYEAGAKALETPPARTVDIVA